MSAEAGIRRRELLTIALWLGLATRLRPSVQWSAPAARPQLDSLSASVAGLLKYKESARIVGRTYLQNVPQEADAQTLVNLLSLGPVHNNSESRNATTNTLRELLQLRMRQDFEEGQIVKLQGWILSVTEARLCALVALG
ncbi:MAG TPA: hypothetical protein DEP84_21305 [Chloroflexi bacterium]|nr:hypothetical protein [Chloroflexota bacterium]